MINVEIGLTAKEIPQGTDADVGIMIDVLRASSVITTALAAGVSYIHAATSIEEARKLKLRYPDALLCGERNATVIDGFDLGNSPIEHQNLQDKSDRILTTTNGTMALNGLVHCKEVFVACFLNLSAIVNLIEACQPKSLFIACAGTNGSFSMDDYLMAGGIIYRMNNDNIRINDIGVAAKMLYQSALGNLHKTLSQTKHYQTLVEKGFADDLEFCLREDIFNLTPQIIDFNQTKIAVRQKQT